MEAVLKAAAEAGEEALTRGDDPVSTVVHHLIDTEASKDDIIQAAVKAGANEARAAMAHTAAIGIYDDLEPDIIAASLIHEHGATEAEAMAVFTAAEKAAFASEPTSKPESSFALTPASAIEGTLDFKTKMGQKIYDLGTKPLDPIEQYDCVQEDMYAFLKLLIARSNEMGWNDEYFGITRIPKEGLEGWGNPETDDLLTNYGEISFERIKQHELTYIDNPSRAAQDTYMLFRCIWNSLSRIGRNKVQIWEHQYKVGTQYSGCLLLKVIIRESHLDSNATTTSIRESLASLYVYILTVNCDIVKFNQHVKLLTDSLAARGEKTTELLTNLFKAYGQVTDKTFVGYMSRKKEMHEEGAGMSADEIMTFAANKYKQLKTQNVWNAPSPEEEKLLALQADFDRLKTSTSKLKNKKQTEKKKKVFKKKTEAKGKSSKGIPKVKPNKDHLSKPPKPLVVKGKKWWLCCSQTGGKCNRAWRRHHPSKCEGKAKGAQSQDDTRMEIVEETTIASDDEYVSE